jgi:hypothetical protein
MCLLRPVERLIESIDKNQTHRRYYHVPEFKSDIYIVSNKFREITIKNK